MNKTPELNQEQPQSSAEATSQEWDKIIKNNENQLFNTTPEDSADQFISPEQSNNAAAFNGSEETVETPNILDTFELTERQAINAAIYHDLADRIIAKINQAKEEGAPEGAIKDLESTCDYIVNTYFTNKDNDDFSMVKELEAQKNIYSSIAQAYADDIKILKDTTNNYRQLAERAEKLAEVASSIQQEVINDMGLNPVHNEKAAAFDSPEAQAEPENQEPSANEQEFN